MILSVRWLTVLLLAASLPLKAQFLKPDNEVPAAQWSFRLEPAGDLKVGQTVTLVAEGTPAPGWHIYAAESPDGVFKPTALLFEGTTGARAQGPLVGSGKEKRYRDDVMEGLIVYYEGKASFRQQLVITAEKGSIQGEVSFQYCDEGRCVFPSQTFRLAFTAQPGNGSTLPVNTKPGEVPSEKTTPEDSGNASESPKAPTEQPGPVSNVWNDPCRGTQPEPDSSGLFWSLLQAFGFGLLALVTPCVFPIIPATVTFFTKQSRTRRQGLRNAVLFVASIIGMFVLIGLGITLAFGADTLYNLSINPWVNLAFFALLVLFALSFLGLFNIELPSSWTTRADKMSGSTGLVGIFFMALTTVLASFSCTGPLIGTALVEAADKPLGAFATMLGFALGFGLPFGLFAAFPGWLNSMPRSGGWLNTVKVSLGLLELALAFKFLSMTDLYWGLHLLDRDVFLAIWIAIFLVLAYYLLGRFRFPHDSPTEKVSVVRGLLAMASLCFAVYLVPGLFGAPLAGLSGVLPPPGNSWSLNSTTAGGEVCQVQRRYAEEFAKETPEGFCAFYDLEEAAAFARRHNKPLFIDFTGKTCANCRQMERNVWPTDAIKPLLTKDYVLVSLFADSDMPLQKPVVAPDGTVLRSLGKFVQQLEQHRYGKISQPLYALTDPNLCTLLPPVGYTPDVQEFKAFLDSGLKTFRKKALKEQNKLKL